MNIFCFRSEGVIHADARPLLFARSVLLLLHGQKKSICKAELFTLTITYTGDRGRIGPYAGPCFNAVIETAARTAKVSYLVDDADITAAVAMWN